MKQNKTKRCMGQCCRRFTLPMNPEELYAAYLYWLNHSAESINKNSHICDNNTLYSRHDRLIQDIHLIYPMVIYLGKFNKTPEGFSIDHEIYHYTCKHHDQKTGNCTIYDIRPSMCKLYPYGRKCYYKGCTNEYAASKEEIKSKIKSYQNKDEPKKG